MSFVHHLFSSCLIIMDFFSAMHGTTSVITKWFDSWNVCFGRTEFRAIHETSSNESIFRVTGHLCWEITGYWWIPHTKASYVELWCFLWSAPEYTQLNKQSWGWRYESPTCPLWRHYNGIWRCFGTNFSVLRFVIFKVKGNQILSLPTIPCVCFRF